MPGGVWLLGTVATLATPTLGQLASGLQCRGRARAEPGRAQDPARGWRSRPGVGMRGARGSARCECAGRGGAGRGRTRPLLPALTPPTPGPGLATWEREPGRPPRHTLLGAAAATAP